MLQTNRDALGRHKLLSLPNCVGTVMKDTGRQYGIGPAFRNAIDQVL
jgi:hypothetical protein